MIQITTGDMMHVHGGFGEKTDYTVRNTVRMADAVDGTILAAALEKTQKRFPYLCVRIRRGENAFYYEENSLPVVLLHREGRVVLNSDEVNWHVWAVSYYEDYIHLDCYHGITDGTGMYKVLSTLLYYYCAERYGAAMDKGILAMTDPIMPEETIDPQDALPDIDLSKITMAPMAPAFTLETDGRLTPSEASIWDVAIPQDEFMRFVEDNDSTPGTMISVLFARAIHLLYQEKESTADPAAAEPAQAGGAGETSPKPVDTPKPADPPNSAAPAGNAVRINGKDIISVYVINARPMLGAGNILHNCLGMAIFDYEDRIAKMPLMRQCTIYRGKTFAQSFDETIRNSTTVSANMIREALKSAPTLDAKKEIFGRSFASGEGFVSYLVSYIGKWQYPIIGGYIREFWTHPPNTFSLMVEISAAGGNIFLAIQQRFKEDCVREAFLQELTEYGIPYRICRKMKSDIAHMPEPV